MLVALTVVAAGCGSSSKSKTTAKAVAANAIPVARTVAAPSGAVKPTTASLRRLVRVSKGSGASARIAGLSNMPLQQQLETLDGDLNAFWSGLFAKSNIQWSQPQQVFVQDQPVQTTCNSAPTVGPNDPFLLCNNTFFWTLPWTQQNIASKGDVVLAFNVGIFWSLDVQDQLGYTASLAKSQITKGQYGNQTLCFTGLWVRTIAQRKLFEQGDTATAANFLSNLTAVSNIGPPDVTPQSLAQAFLAGYNSGSPGACSISGSSSGGGGTTTTDTTGGTTTTDTTGGTTTG
jgi:predicted metalloprotease